MNYTTNVEIILAELDAMKIAMWNFHADYLKDNQWYDEILGRDILLELKIELCLSKYS